MSHHTPVFGQALREARITAGYLQRELAKHLRISIPYLSDVEQGNRAPFDPKRILHIAKFFRSDPFDLLIAAAQSYGRFELNAVNVSDLHQQVGRQLMRVWDQLPEETLLAIQFKLFLPLDKKEK